MRLESLVIGIGSYLWHSYLPPLPMVSPTQAVFQASLGAAHWRQRHLSDTKAPTSDYFPTLDNLIAEVEALPAEIELLWVHFSGYAEVFSNEPYLFVQDTIDLNKTHHALSLIDLRRMLEKRKTQSVFITLDTYMPNRTDGQTEIIKDEFLDAAKEALRGMAVIAGRTLPGTARIVNGQPHSVFTSFLAQALAAPTMSQNGVLTLGQLTELMRGALSDWRADHPESMLRPVFRIDGFENLVLADHRSAE